jgi:DNA (cytosine-5)-methyltransferase 1
MVIIENVKGISIEFGKKERDSLKGKIRGRKPKPFADHIMESLEKIGYIVVPKLLKAVDFGVPQLRPKYFLIGVKNSISNGFNPTYLQDIINKTRIDFLKAKDYQLISTSLPKKHFPT